MTAVTNTRKGRTRSLLGGCTLVLGCFLAVGCGESSSNGGNSGSGNADGAASSTAATTSSQENVVMELTPQQAEKALADTQDLTILDVRRPDEFAAGHIAGAENINFEGADFMDQVNKLDKAKPTFVYCRSGNRSTQAVAAMKAAGFTNILHLSDGVIGWDQAGLELVK